MNYSKLKDICITTQGIQISKDKQINKFKEGYIKYLYIADFKGENEEKFVENVYPEKIVTENDLVMANTGSPGAVFKGINGVLSNNLFKISFDRNILDRDFLYYYLASDKFQSNLQQRMKGGVQKHLGHKTIGEQDIPIIDINTQKRIVTVLNKSQKLINKRKEQIDSLDKLVKSKFIEMFGDPVSNPKRWEKQICRDISSKIGSGATPSGGNSSYKEEGISLIRSMNVHNNKFVYKDLAFIDDEQAKKLKNVIIEKNDILLNITGASVARCCIVPSEIIPARVNQHVSIVRTKQDIIIPVFLCYQFTNDTYQRMLWNIATSGGATREAITKQQVENLEVIIPPIELQNQFADFVKQVDKLKFEMEKSLKKLEDNFNSLMQKAFKGELFN